MAFYQHPITGRFISKAMHALLHNRDPSSGKFITKASAQRRLERLADPRKTENFLRARLGAPPAGKQWSQIAAKYPERFADYLEGQDDY